MPLLSELMARTESQSSGMVDSMMKASAKSAAENEAAKIQEDIQRKRTLAEMQTNASSVFAKTESINQLFKSMFPQDANGGGLINLDWANGSVQ